MKTDTIINIAAGLIATVIYGLVVLTTDSVPWRLILLAIIAIALLVFLVLPASLKSILAAAIRPLFVDRFKKRRFDIIVKELQQGIALHMRRGDVPRIYTTSLGVRNTAHIDQTAFKDFSDILDRAVERREVVNLCLFSIHDPQSASRVLTLTDRFRDNPCLRVRVTLGDVEQIPALLANLFIIERYAGYLAFENVNGETVAFNARRPREVAAMEDLFNNLASRTGFRTLKDENGVKIDVYNAIKAIAAATV